MASRGAIAAIHSEALARVEAATASIVARLGIDTPPPAPHAKQPELRQAWELGRQATLLEAIDRAIAGLAARDEPPAGYEALTVKQLREQLAERGIDVAKDAKKADLVAALDAADAHRAEFGDPESKDPDAETGEDEPVAEDATP